MTEKEQAREELRQLMARAEALKAILDETDELARDPREEWSGRWGFFNECDPDCPDRGELKRLRCFDPRNKERSFVSSSGMYWRYFRPATPEDLGIDAVASIEPDWGKAPKWARYWACDANGACFWYELEPIQKDIYWSCAGLHITRDSRICPNWRDTLRKRPDNEV